MHKVLEPEKIPHCAEIIRRFKACHKESSWFQRAWGGCDDLRRELDICLRQDYEMRRESNLRDSLERKERFKQRHDAREAALKAALPA